jgi:hypothetical protein
MTFWKIAFEGHECFICQKPITTLLDVRAHLNASPRTNSDHLAGLPLQIDARNRESLIHTCRICAPTYRQLLFRLASVGDRKCPRAQGRRSFISAISISGNHGPPFGPIQHVVKFRVLFASP